MTRIPIILLTLFLASCGQISEIAEKSSSQSIVASSADTSKIYSINKVAEVDFVNAKSVYKNKLIYDTLTYRKVNGVIKLPINSSEVYFRDSIPVDDETETKEYEYIGQLAQLGFYIVRGIFY